MITLLPHSPTLLPPYPLLRRLSREIVSPQAYCFSSDAHPLSESFTLPEGAQWRDRSAQVLFLEWLGGRKKISKFSDWCDFRLLPPLSPPLSPFLCLHFIAHSSYNRYSIRHSDIIQHKGSALLRHHSSVFTLLSTLFPLFSWEPFLFPSAPQGYWSREVNRKRYIDWFATKRRIQRFQGTLTLLPPHPFTFLSLFPLLLPAES